MLERRQYHNNTSFLDVLFNTLVGFVLLFTIAFLLIAPVVDKSIKMKAEFIITVTWNTDSQDDVDTWLEDPMGNILFFRQKEIGAMHLDKDDLGYLNDTITLPNGEQVVIKINQEIVTIRGFIPGEWTLNVHMYNKRDAQGKTVSAGRPTTVVVRIDKLNPKVRTILQKEITLIEKGQEETVVRLTMAANGDIIAMDDLPKELVKSKVM